MSMTAIEKNGHKPAAMTPWQDDDDFQVLSPHSPNGVRDDAGNPRINFIATISAGYKGPDDKYPKRSKSGEIYIDGKPHNEFCNAPGLESILKNNDYMRLTAVFPSDRKTDFIQQRFTEYTATELKAFGDQHSVTELVGTGKFKKEGDRKVEIKERHIYDAGTQEYAEVISRCNVACSVYFALAQWTGNGANIIFPDGVGLYRIRFTSMKSLDAFIFAVDYTKRMTGGILAGVPFDLFLEQKEGSDGDGVRRKSWIWQARTSADATAGKTLDAAMYRQLATHGQHQVQMMQLQAPEPETIETAIADADIATVVDDDAVEGEVLSNESTPDPEPEQPKTEPAAPALCDARDYQKKYFAIAGQTSFAGDEGRAQFIMAMTKGKIKSLSKVLSTMTAAQADAMMATLQEYVNQEIKEKQSTANQRQSSATPPTRATDPLKRHKKKIINQAKELWGDDYKAKLPAVLGQANWDGLTAKDLDSTVAMLNKMIKANAAPAAPAATPDLELTPDPEPESHEPAKTPLSEKVREKREAASAPSPDDGNNPFEDDDEFNVNSDGEVIE